MAKQTLPINFVDDILAQPMGGKRKFAITDNGDGTYSIEDVTEYTQIGSDFGASQMNQTNQAVNDSCDKADVIDDLDDIVANQAGGMIAGAKAVAELISKTKVETFELIPSSNISTLAQKCYYEPLTGRVHIEAAHYLATGIPASEDLAVIPEKYAPKTTNAFPLAMDGVGGIGYMYNDGKIRQNASTVRTFAYYSTEYYI